MRRSLTTSNIDLARLRSIYADPLHTSGDDEVIVALLDAIGALLATPTPMPHGSSDYDCGWDSGWGAFRREARRLFGVGDE